MVYNTVRRFRISLYSGESEIVHSIIFQNGFRKIPNFMGNISNWIEESFTTLPSWDPVSQNQFWTIPKFIGKGVVNAVNVSD